MAYLKFHGNVLKQYHGLDKDTVVVAGPGDVIHVSEEKAARLLKDFPSEFEAHHARGGSAPELPDEPIHSNMPEAGTEVADIKTKEDQPAKDKMVKQTKTKVRNKWR